MMLPVRGKMNRREVDRVSDLVVEGSGLEACRVSHCTCRANDSDNGHQHQQCWVSFILPQVTFAGYGGTAEDAEMIARPGTSRVQIRSTSGTSTSSSRVIIVRIPDTERLKTSSFLKP